MELRRLKRKLKRKYRKRLWRVWMQAIFQWIRKRQRLREIMLSTCNSRGNRFNRGERKDNQDMKSMRKKDRLSLKKHKK